MFDIIQINADSGPPSLDDGAKKTVRSNAMRHFKRKQKEARNKGNGKKRVVLPAYSESVAIECIQETTKPQTHNENYDEEPVEQTALTPATTTSGTCSVGTCSDTSAPIIVQPGGAEFYRYILAEAFGVNLVGSGPRRTHSTAITDFRRYVATTRSDIMHATDDSICLLLQGCTLNDDRILLEGRKRHLAGIECMRASLKDDKLDVDSTVASAIELIFADVFKPTSLGAKNLYAGVVYLVRSSLPHLITSRTPVSIFLLIQLRQMMLVMSLASRTPLPLGIETWAHLGSVSTLPTMTESLMQLAILLPDALHTANEVKQSVSTDPLAFQWALSRLLGLEKRLRQWNADHGARSWSIDKETSHSPCIGIHEGIDFLTAQCETMSRICLLLLQQALASLFLAQGKETPKRYYTTQAAQNADALCFFTKYFIREEADGSLSKALSVRAPLHFARQWYEANGDRDGLSRVSELEAQVQKEVHFVAWESLLPLSLVSMYMLE